MGIYDEFKEELPLFFVYIMYMYKNKATALVATSQTKKIQFCDLRE